MKSELTFCPNCDKELLNERVDFVLEDQQFEDWDSAYEFLQDDGEINLCSDCYEWDNSDDDDAKGEGWE
jgi:hypothetical protein